MKHNAAVTRIAHDLCELLDDDWKEGHKLYLARAQTIYDREIKPIRGFLVLLTAEIEILLEHKWTLSRLSCLTTNATRKLEELKR